MSLPEPPVIESARLVVRRVDPADLPDLLHTNRDAEVTRFLPYAAWQSAADGQAWFERMAGIQATGTAHQFVVVHKGSGEVIGTCLLFRHDAASARAELGYVLGRAHWGHGFMAEALEALLDCAFGPLGLRRIEAEIDPRNTASLRLIARLGFTREGLLRQRWIAKGEAVDVVIHGLLRDEWRATPPAA